MKNLIPRSYFEISSNDLNIFFNDDILNCDALIIRSIDLNTIFSDFSNYQEKFALFIKTNLQIYVLIDGDNLKEEVKILRNLDYKYLSGIAIINSSTKVLNKLSIFARELEFEKRLDFGYLKFIPYINTIEALNNYRKIASYFRVTSIYLDFLRLKDYIGNDYLEPTIIKNQLLSLIVLSKKPFIDSYHYDSKTLLDNLYEGKKYLVTSKLTKDLSQVSIINDFFTPKEEEILKAKEIYEKLSQFNDKKVKIKDIKVSKYNLLNAQITLSRANLLDDDMMLIVKGEKVKQASKIFKPKRFYTFQEEIANGITHGLGVILSIIFLILLLIKSSSFNQTLSYIIYFFSVFCLYISSTMYHVLPLGSASKRLFHKFDRMSIYLLIAGTYTPLTLNTIGGKVGLTLFIILWCGALLGIILNFIWFGRLKLVHMFLYVLLGWIAIFYLDTIFASLSLVSALLILFGGITYTIGIIFYSLKLFKYTHMIWHIFTIIGTILHFIAIYLA